MTEQEIKDELSEYNLLLSQQKFINDKVKKAKQKIITNCFADQTPDTEGVEKVEIANCIIKRTCKLNRTLTKDQDEIERVIQGLESVVAKERLISFKPALSLAEYRKLTPSDKRLVDEILEVKLAAPTVTIEGDFS